MGYYGNGFVFTSAPNWAALETLPSNFGFTGYRHDASEVFVLDVWRCTGRQHWPFTDVIGEIAEWPLPSATEDVLARFDQICKAIQNARIGQPIYGGPLLRLTAHLSSALGVDTFSFAGDDELIDMAANARGGALNDFRVRFGASMVVFGGGALRVIPRSYEEDGGEMTYSEDVLARIRAVPGVTVTETEHLADGDGLYENAVRLWPPAAGDPAKLLGIGTWDPFLQIQEGLFSEVVSRVCPVTVKPRRSAPPPIAVPKKPWWRFW